MTTQNCVRLCWITWSGTSGTWRRPKREQGWGICAGIGARVACSGGVQVKTQDFVCPECGATVKAREVYPLSDDDYYYPAGKVAVLKIKGYHWVEPYPHME